MAKWIQVERADGDREYINSDLVQRVRVFERVTRLVFRAMPGGYDEIAVTGSATQAVARLDSGAAWPDARPVVDLAARCECGAGPLELHRPRCKVLAAEMAALGEKGRTNARTAPPKSRQKRSQGRAKG